MARQRKTEDKGRTGALDGMTQVPLAELRAHPGNVRAASAVDAEGIAALAASIKALGLLQGLVVQPLPEGGYGVLAGRRRWMALTRLVAAGDLPADAPTPCRMIPIDAPEIAALSLAENFHQAPMHPMELYDAFAAMAQEGMGVARIALAFGMTERRASEILRYGLVHPELRAAARAGRMSLDTLKAFAAHPDQGEREPIEVCCANFNGARTAARL